MVEFSGLPRQRTVASVTLRTRHHVVLRLTNGMYAIVAGRTGMGCYAYVIEASWHPRIRSVASLAGVARGNMVFALALLRDTVMATHASRADGAAMIEGARTTKRSAANRCIRPAC